MKRNFEEWLKTFKRSIANYSYYVDFNTVMDNSNNFKDQLLKMNCLLGSKNIEEDFINLIKSDESVLNCIPTLLATRDKNIFCMDSEGEFDFHFNKRNYSIEDYAVFMRKTGLFSLMESNKITNLFDYVVGVQAGLNSNARKNRGGTLMEDLVESYIKKAGYVKDHDYFKEIYTSELEQVTGLDLSAITNNGDAEKRFDFALLGKTGVIAIECNFYASAGSKLNETARSYKTLALESKTIKGLKFVWFTDGQGWNHARHNLKETFDILDTVYNIHELENGIMELL